MEATIQFIGIDPKAYMQQLAELTAEIILSKTKNNEVWLNQKQAASFYDVTPATVRNWELNGKIIFRRKDSTAEYLCTKN